MQLTHEVAEGAAWKVPVRQPEHCDVPSWAAKVPGEQSEHTDARVLPWNLPSAQGWHADCWLSAVAYPAGQD